MEIGCRQQGGAGRLIYLGYRIYDTDELVSTR